MNHVSQSEVREEVEPLKPSGLPEPPTVLAASSGEPPASPALLACCLALAPASAIGFGRFAYALVLPAMRSDLHLSYAQAGTLNTANMVGYLAGAVLTTRMLRRVPLRLALLAGLGTAIAALLLAGWIGSYPGLLFCRALVGLAAAFTFIASTSLAAHLGRNEAESALALGLTIGGPGVGSMVAGLVVPFVVAAPARWPLAWQILGGVGALAWLVVWKGTRALESTATVEVGACLARRQRAEAAPRYGALWATFAAYFLFGLGYIAYMTFLVAFVQGLGASAGTVAMVWTALGAAMVASTFVWRRALSRPRGGGTLALMGVGGAVAAALPLFSRSFPVLLISAVMFGLTTMPVFTAVALLIRRFLPPAAWSSGIAAGTVVFAAGQSLGPVGSGMAADAFGPSASLVWSLVILLLAAGVALLQVAEPQSER